METKAIHAKHCTSLPKLLHFTPRKMQYGQTPNPVPSNSSEHASVVDSGCSQQLCQKDNVIVESSIADDATVDAFESSVLYNQTNQSKQRNLSCPTCLSTPPLQTVHSPQTAQSSFSAPPEHISGAGLHEQGQTNDTFWQRLKWGFVLSFCRRRSSSNDQNRQPNTNTAATLEMVIMGSALILTAGLQIQEIVASRGGFDPQNSNTLARDVFLLASSMSFTLSFYSIVTSSVLLISLSSCTPR